MINLERQPIHNADELSFAIFCIENVAINLGVSAEKVYDHCMSAAYLHTFGHMEDS